MSRKRADLGPGADDRIVAMMARGLGAEAIAKELGAARATVGRRMAELKGGVPAVRAARRAPTLKFSLDGGKTMSAVKTLLPAPAPLPDADAELDPGTPLEQIAEWLAMAREEVDAARSAGDVDTMQKMMRLAASLLTLQQKSTPEAPPDPNLNPDFIAAAERARKKLHDRIDAIVREVKP